MSRHHDEFSGTTLPSNYSEDIIYRQVGDLAHAKTLRTGDSTVKVDPILHHQVQRIVAAVPGYRSVSDFWRDALYHRAAYWGEKIDDSELVASICNMLEDGALAYITATEDYHLHLFDELCAVIDRTKSPETKIMLKLEIQNKVNRISDPYWAKKFSDLANSF